MSDSIMLKPLVVSSKYVRIMSNSKLVELSKAFVKPKKLHICEITAADSDKAVRVLHAIFME